jgi:hypothetical protein
MEALELATAPRIVPPAAPPPCGQNGGIDVQGGFAHVGTVGPTSITVAPDGASLSIVLAMEGFTPTPDLASALAAAALPGTAFLVLDFVNPPADAVTRTLRVVDGSPADVTLSLLQGALPSTTVTAYLFSPAGAVVSGVPFAPASVPILWTGYGTSNYAALAAQELYAAPGSWVVDTSSHGVLFDTTTVPGGQIIPALEAAYFSRAGTYGDVPDPTTCLTTAPQVASASSSEALACPAGALARVAAGGCEETVAPGDVDPALLRCGGIADDLAVALSGLPPRSAWVTRARTVILGGSFGADHEVQAGPSSTLGPVFTAASYALSCSASTTSTSTGGNPSPGATGTSSAASSSGSSADMAAGNAAGDILSGVADSAASSDGCSCGSGDSSSSDDSCNSDSSDSSGGCGGDGSSSDGGCSGDSGGGDSCGGGSSDCTTAQRGPRRRSSASRVLLALVLGAAVVRRRTRRARR